MMADQRERCTEGLSSTLRGYGYGPPAVVTREQEVGSDIVFSRVAPNNRRGAYIQIFTIFIGGHPLPDSSISS